MLIDSHCHINDPVYLKKPEQYVLEAEQNNVSIMLVVGYDVKSSLDAIKIAEQFDEVYAAVGIIPAEVKNMKPGDLKEIEKLLTHKKVIAVGEIGLDYYWTKDNKDKQKEVFENQLKIAEKYNIPVIVHSRDSIQDVYDILKKYKVRGSIHAFSGSLEMANKFIDLGYKLGIGGVITFRNSNLKYVISKIDINNIILETDSPYLSPEPVRGKKNSPLNLKYVVEFIANLNGIGYEEVINITNENVRQLFDL